MNFPELTVPVNTWGLLAKSEVQVCVLNPPLLSAFLLLGLCTAAVVGCLNSYRWTFEKMTLRITLVCFSIPWIFVSEVYREMEHEGAGRIITEQRGHYFLLCS